MKQHRLELALLAAAALSIFAVPLLRGEVFTLRDHFDYFQPLRWFTAAELRAGHLPLWNPYSASGEPWLANPQTAVFYPPAWLFLVLPFATAYMLFLLLHLIVLGWGAYLLFARGASQGAALVGAVAVMFSGPVLSLLDVNNNLATLAWIPLALWCAAEGAWRRGGVVLALAFLGGEPFFAGVAALMYVIVARRAAIGAGVVAFGLSAVQLFPFLELVSRSDRAAGLDESLILLHSMSLRDWLRVAIPPKLDEAAIDPNLTQHFIPIVYVGMLVCALAIVGVASSGWRLTVGGWRTRRAVSPANRQPSTANAFWIVLLIIAFAVSLGPSLLARLPLTLFRYPARLVPLAALAIAALAVAGWERIRPQRRWVDLVIVLLVVIDLAPRAWPLLQSAPFRRDVVPYPRVGMETKFLRVGAIDANRRAWISGYLNLYDRRYDAFTAAPVASDAYVRMHRRLQEKPSQEELARKGIGWVLTKRDFGIPPMARAGDVRVYRNRSTLPMAFLVIRTPTTVVPLRPHLGTAEARVTVDAPREGVVVLLQQNAPGWRAFLDGLETKLVPIDGLFRGVQVTRGRHEIVWTYRPASFFAGAATTALTLLAMTLFSFVKRAR